jgi:dihydroorotase
MASGSDDSFLLPLPDDFHVHLRQGPELDLYVARHSECFGRALVMPNTLPPVADAETLGLYRRQIREAAAKAGRPFEALLAFKLLPGMSAETVTSCVREGAVAGKYYPAGTTTNALDGPSRPEDVTDALDAMEDSGIVLSIHGEDPDAPVLEREGAFLRTLDGILRRWPRLRIVLEHLSTAQAVRYVAEGPDRLAATITAHHLLFTLDDLMGGGMNPHLFCKPVLKTAVDREALRTAAFSGSPKFFFGSDSAPHSRLAKEKGLAPGGVYSSPVAVPALVELFDRNGALEALPRFFSLNGAAYYGLAPASGRLRLARESWIVPQELDGAVPMLAGKTLGWKAAGRTV